MLKSQSTNPTASAMSDQLGRTEGSWAQPFPKKSNVCQMFIVTEGVLEPQPSPFWQGTGHVGCEGLSLLCLHSLSPEGQLGVNTAVLNSEHSVHG